MTEERIGDDEDRRVLLGMYSSGQLQWAGIVVALSAGVLAETGLLLQFGSRSPWYGSGLFELTVVTLFLDALVLDQYFVMSGSLQKLLELALPTSKEFIDTLAQANALFPKPWNRDPSSGVGRLDHYSSCKVRLSFNKPWHISRITWKGKGYFLVRLIAIILLTFIVLVIYYL